MDQWRQSLLAIKQKSPAKSSAVDSILEGISGVHQWYQMNHHRPVFCNYCREKLSGLTWHGWSCEICKIKVHKRCISKIAEKCKWTVECSIPSQLRHINAENTIVAHQWVEGNLAMSSKCIVCEKVCGSVLKLADWRCLWCACCVHSSCLPQLGRGCSLGPTSLSILPPLAVKGICEEGLAEIRTDAVGGVCGGGSPLLVLVNSKSGDNQGLRMIRKFKRLLNPLQVFDIIVTGPDFALSFFNSFDCFRVLVCGGDGTVGWVLGAFDRLGLHNKCQLAILPIGTGNDLARVLGWGHAFYDDTQLPRLIRTFERAHTRMLDRWSVLSIEGPQATAITQFEDIIAKKLGAVMKADDPRDVLRAVKCSTLLQKLNALMQSLDTDETKMEESGVAFEDDERRHIRESLVRRANSLKKALKDIMSVAERGISKHNCISEATTKCDRFRRKRSKSTMSALKASSSNLSSSSKCFPPVNPIRRNRFDHFSVKASDTQVSQTIVDGARQDTSFLRNYSCDIDECDVEGDAEEPMLSSMIGRILPPTSFRRRSSSVNETERPSIDSIHHYLPNCNKLFKMNSESKLHIQRGDISTNIRTSRSDSSLYGCTVEDITRFHDYNRSQMNECKKVDKPSDLERNMIYAEMAGSSLIAEVLLLNARVLGLRAVSSLYPTPLNQYREQKVMNNYFGIGLDAKIALEFHNKREESEKTRSRSRLFMWYGILGGKELMHRTYRNLDQRIRLECDGVPIDLPSLQGIVILNIPSYSGGANFWGNAKDDTFRAQSFDDRLLEVVALFGVIHVATSRVPNVVRLQNHRIAQCRHIRIIILGNDPIPVQVDGEPWLQPPGILQIVHKNRAQLLVRNAAFDAILKRWEEQKERTMTPSTPTSLSLSVAACEEFSFAQRAGAFVQLVESEIAQLGVSSGFLEALEAAVLSVRAVEDEGDYNGVECQALRAEALEAIELVVRRLEDHFGWTKHTVMVDSQSRLGSAPLFPFEIHGNETDHWRQVLLKIRQEISKEEATLRDLRLVGTCQRKRNWFTDWITRKWRRHSDGPSSSGEIFEMLLKMIRIHKISRNVHHFVPCFEKYTFKHRFYYLEIFVVTTWSMNDVSLWLNSLGLAQYTKEFKSNDIQGYQLVHLERSDMKDLGIHKMAHAERLQSAIAELRRKEMESRSGSRCSRRKGARVSLEHAQVRSTNELPSLSSV